MSAVRDKIPTKSLPTKKTGSAEPAIGEHHPLADLAGSYSGEDWEATLEFIRKNREIDRKLAENVD